MKNFIRPAILLSLLLTCMFLYGDVGYVSKGGYFNTWRVNTVVGATLVDLVLPYDLYIDTIIVSGNQPGFVLLKVGNYEVKRYPYVEFQPTGEVLPVAMFVAAGTHVTAILEDGMDGYHTVSISGHF